MSSNQASFTKQPPRKNRGNRQQSPKAKQQKSNQLNASFQDSSRLLTLLSHDQSKLASKSDQSFFHHQDDENQQNKDKKTDVISQKSAEDDEQLQPDKIDQSSKSNKLHVSKLDESNWDDENKNENEVKKQKQTIKQGTNTRGNRDNSKQKQLKAPSNNARNINPDHQLPSQSNGPKKRGNRFPDQQKGQNGGYGKQNYYNGQNQSGYNRNNNNYNSNRGWRGGSSRGGGYQSSGYRGGNYNSSYRNYNSGKQDQNNQNNQNNYYNKDKRFGTDSDGMNQSTYKPDFNKKPKYHDQKGNSYPRNNYDKSFGNEYSGGRGFNNKTNYSQPQVVEKIIEKEVIVQKEVIKIMQPPRPTGIRVQPAVSMFIKGCKLTLTCRRLEQFTSDVLIIPYKTPKLELYPGSFVNSCEVNYKQKLKQKGPQLLQDGKLVYMQKCIGQNKFKAFAFLNVADPQNNIKNGIKQVFETLKILSKNTKQKQINRFESIVFPISTDLGQAKTVLSTLVKQIQKYSTFVKDVYVTTQEHKAFCEAVTKFNEIFSELFEQNQISIN